MACPWMMDGQGYWTADRSGGLDVLRDSDLAAIVSVNPK
jgi:hypothetical protein